MTGRQLKALREFVDTHQLPFGILVNQSTEVECSAKKSCKFQRAIGSLRDDGENRHL